uniref:PLAT domain-containing protein n=1 Tax=Heterorhabditis bacteriophora TaxID=37862 RepID=A0A1I7X5A7_HETBA
MNSRFGGNGRRDTVKLDKKHVLPHDKEYPVDAVFFDGSNEAGWYFTLGTAQRKNDIINLFFILRIPDVGTFVNPEIASNTNVKSIHSTNEWITESGFTVSCVVPMKIWNLRFKGDLIKSPGEIIFDTVGVMADNNAERIHAEFNLEWTNFGTKPLSIYYLLSNFLFQFGFLSGFYKIGHHEFNDIRLTSMRDHTIANHRRWSDIRRYIMMIYHLIDGTCIHTSIISMPGIVFTQLEFGYIITP